LVNDRERVIPEAGSGRRVLGYEIAIKRSEG